MLHQHGLRMSGLTRQHAHWTLRVDGRRSPGHPWEEAQRLARANGPTSTCDLDIPATFKAAGIA